MTGISRFEDVDKRLFSRNDENGEAVYFLDKACTQPFTGILYSKNQSWRTNYQGWLEFEAEIRDGFENGIEIVYHKNGLIEQISQCKANLHHGISKEYDEDGYLKTVSVVCYNSYRKTVKVSRNKEVHSVYQGDSNSPFPDPEEIKKLLDLPETDLLSYPLKSEFGLLDKVEQGVQLKETSVLETVLSKEDVLKTGRWMDDGLDFIGDDYDPCAYLVYEDDKDKKFTGLCYDFYRDSENLYSYDYYKDGLREGQSVEFYPNGRVKKVFEMKKGIGWGANYEYYETGQLQYQSQLIAGVTMTYAYYNQNGRILEEKKEPTDFDKRIALKFGGEVWPEEGNGGDGKLRKLTQKLKNIFRK